MKIRNRLVEKLFTQPGELFKATGEVEIGRYGIKAAVGGGFIVTIDGVQTGGNRDRSGAGDQTFKTAVDAKAFVKKLQDEEDAENDFRDYHKRLKK